MTGSPDGPGTAELLPEEPEGPEEGEGVEVEEEEEVDALRPRVVTVAFWLLITSAVLWVLVSGSVSADPAAQQGTAAILCFYIWAAARIRRGRWTARIVGTIAAVWLLVVLGTPGALGFMNPENPYGREYTVLAVVAVVLTGTGVALLYGRRGTTYFRRRPW